MSWLILQGGQVRLKRHLPKGIRQIGIDEDRAEEDVTALVSRLCSGLSDEIWQLELARFAAMHERLALLYATTLAEAGPGPVALNLPDRLCKKRVRGLCCALIGKPDGALRETALQLLAGLVAGGILLALILRHGGSSPTLLCGIKEQLLALHAEQTNRSRHILRMAQDRAAPVFLILGRPGCSLQKARSLLDPEETMPQARYIRPLSLRACLRGLWPGLRRILQGADALGDTGLRPDFRDRLAMSYRVMQGMAHVSWWAKKPVKEVVFGHTGNADTSLLERAIQRQGGHTVHAVHGTGLGWAFAGLSDLALFHNGHDARVAADLPGYGRCSYLETPMPALARGGERWLLLTSYTHPLNPDYAVRGAFADMSVVHWLAQAARALGQRPENILWRPHPMLAQCAAEKRSALQEAVAQAGFTPWPKDMAYEEMTQFGQVITTPSTALIDALRLGVLPVLAISAPLQRDLVYGVYPLQARNTKSLHTTLSNLSCPQARAQHFTQCWDRLRLGRDS